jgi:hypothetical protein
VVDAHENVNNDFSAKNYQNIAYFVIYKFTKNFSPESACTCGGVVVGSTCSHD